MASNADAWLKQAKEVLSEYEQNRSARILPFTISLLDQLYGSQSAQLNAFNTAMAQISKQSGGPTNTAHFQGMHAYEVVKNTIAEIENGLIVRIRVQVAGEVLSELVGLGKEILTDGADSAKNVSSVLIAAAFEDLIRRMGSEFAGIAGRPKLESILTSLKEAQVLQGGAVGLAQSYLKFRNDSLHADWEKVDRPQIQSCVAFIEGLLLKHFS